MPKQISYEAADALMNRRPFKKSNTRVVEVSEQEYVLELFGNPIAKIYKDRLYITTAGYETVTTKDRLNAIPGVAIFQHKGKWHLNGQPWIFNGGWTDILERGGMGSLLVRMRLKSSPVL